MKIYPKILLITLPMIILPVFLAGVVSYFIASNALEQVARNILEAKAEQAVDICKNHLVTPKLGTAVRAKAQGDAVEKIYNRSKQGPEFVLIVDSSGTILHHPSQEFINNDISALIWFNNMKEHKQGFDQFIWRDTEYWAAFRTFPAWDWYVLGLAREDDMTGPMKQLGVIILVVGFSAVLLAALPLLLFTRKLTDPIYSVIQGTEQIRRGDLDTHIPISTEDEIGVMAGAFNAMTSRLKTLINRLEERNLALVRENEERTRAEKEVREKEERFRSLVTNIPGAVYRSRCGPQWTMHFISENIFDISGYPPRDFIDNRVRSYLSIIHPEDRDTVKKEVQMGREEKRPFVLEYRIIHADGSTRWVYEKGQPFPGPDGTPLWLDGAIFDITPQKTAAEEKARLEVQLRQGQKMEALGTLAGGIAHDFNNLLQGMSGYIQLLLMRKTEQDPDYKYLMEVDKTADRATNLVKRLLTFSRKMEINYEPVSLNEIVRSTIKLLERTIPKMVTIETHLDPDLSVIQADPIQMEQVLMNLATNAVDAMDGSGTLNFETHNFTVDKKYKEKYLELQSGEYIQLKVSDTGTGMDEETRRRIFEPFFTTKEPGKGTGMGLATSYGIVKGHQGHIHCYSDLGEGTTFSIYLPVGHMPGEIGKGEEKIVTEIKSGTETVLVVDDEDIIREIAEEVLTQYGYFVINASSGEEALEIFKRNMDTIDLVILDLGMPGMGGEKCLKELKKVHPQVKVIVASGYSAHKIAKYPKKFGAAGFLSKPYRLDQLATRVREVLDK